MIPQNKYTEVDSAQKVCFIQTVLKKFVTKKFSR